MRGLGGGGGPFWRHREALTFRGPAAYQNTAVFQIGVNKIPPNFDTLFATAIWVVRLFKGLTARHIYGSFGAKGLRAFSIVSSHITPVAQCSGNFYIPCNCPLQLISPICQVMAVFMFQKTAIIGHMAVLLALGRFWNQGYLYYDCKGGGAVLLAANWWECGLLLSYWVPTLTFQLQLALRSFFGCNFWCRVFVSLFPVICLSSLKMVTIVAADMLSVFNLLECSMSSVLSWPWWNLWDQDKIVLWSDVESPHTSVRNRKFLSVYVWVKFKF
jgi:hypothetical protein